MLDDHGPFPSGIQYQLLPDEAKRVCQIVRSKYAYGNIGVAGIARAVYPGENTTKERVVTTQYEPVFFDHGVEGDVDKIMSRIKSGIYTAIEELIGKGVDRSTIKVLMDHKDYYEPDLCVSLKYRFLETDEQYNERMEKMVLYQLMLDKVLPASLELAKEMKK